MVKLRAAAPSEVPDHAMPDAGPSAEPMAYQREERSRTLAVVIWIVLAAAVILGAFDIQFHTWSSVVALFGLALLCIPVYVLNQRGRYVLAASILSLIVLAVVSVNLFDGDGARDPGIMAYPIFVMAGALLFGRRSAPYFALAAGLSLAGIVTLEVTGLIRPTIGPVKFDILIPTITLIAASAGIVWIIIRNLERHIERASQARAELSKNYDLTLEGWARVMEYRDRETEGHSRRLVTLATRLGRELGMSEADILSLRRGALLHDIGKLGIPDEILLKPGPLTEDEMRLMQKHPLYAKQMLEGIPFLASAIRVAYSHHERWDGNGYPEGLNGEEIPLTARVFAIVDSWDALCSKRVYRPAWTSEQARSYIEQNAGSRFDPRIVRAFLKMVE